MKDNTWKPAKDEARQLRRAGYDGLYFPGECACLVDDLYPCGERHPECRPGYKGTCTDECTHEGAGECDWHISAKRDTPLPAPPWQPRICRRPTSRSGRFRQPLRGEM